MTERGISRPMERVGREVSAASYWKERGDAYRAKLGGVYHAHRLAVVGKLMEGVGFDGRVCLDFGCGDGAVSSLLIARGASVIGVDVDEAMIEAARRQLAEAGARADMRVGGVEALERLAGGAVDHLIALNVLAYLSDGEERRFYREAYRIVRPGGSLIVMHSNELFDLFTLNAFTVAFFARHFTSDAARGIAFLLTHPDEPDRTAFNVRENPLTYRYKLATYGFHEVAQEFANLHVVPPLLMDREALADIDKKTFPETLGWAEADRWKLMFMCSMFGSRAVRRPTGAS